MDVLVRDEISLKSKELFTVPPGHYVQQAGPAEIFVSGQAQGIVRMPVLSRGWATVDATAVGGPRYLVPVRAATWQVVFTSGDPRGDIVVREHLSLESGEVAMLFNGSVVEQSGPQEVEDGLTRMPIVFAEPSPAASSKAPRTRRGWVTCDATSQGGPRFFAPVEVDEDPLQPPAAALPDEASQDPRREGGGRDGAGGGRGRAPGSSWDRNRIWRVANLLEDGSKLLAVVKLPEPFAPDKDKAPGENLVKWIANGDVVEQVGHSKKSRGYMVMPVRLEARMGDDAVVGGEADGWVTRRLVDRDRDAVGGSWFEEVLADGRAKPERERRGPKRDRHNEDREPEPEEK